MNFTVIFDRTLKPYLLILSLVFAAAFLAGTFAPASIGTEAGKMFQFIADNYEALAGGKLFLAILLQNVTASILILLSGVLAGIIPLISIGSNGYFLGVLYRQAAEGGGYSKAALKVLPHGLIEFPALLIVASYGLWLGVMAIRRSRGRESTPLRFHIEHAFRRYFAVVFPLLVIAAAIETALILALP